MLTFSHRFPGKHGCSDGTGNIKVGGDNDFLAGNFFKSGYYRFVIGNSTLEKDMITNAFFPDHFLNVILNNGVCQASNEVLLLHSFLLM